MCFVVHDREDAIGVAAGVGVAFHVCDWSNSDILAAPLTEHGVGRPLVAHADQGCFFIDPLVGEHAPILREDFSIDNAQFIQLACPSDTGFVAFAGRIEEGVAVGNAHHGLVDIRYAKGAEPIARDIIQSSMVFHHLCRCHWGRPL